MPRALGSLASLLLVVASACGGGPTPPPLAESSRAVPFVAPRRDGVAVLEFESDGLMRFNGRELEAGAFDKLEARLTALATSLGAKAPPANLPLELRVADNALRIVVEADTTLAPVAASIDKAIDTLCVQWPGAARIQLDTLSPSLKQARVFPTPLRRLRDMPGISVDKNYVTLSVLVVAAMPEGFDATRRWRVVIRPHIGASEPSEAAFEKLTWSEAAQRVGAAKSSRVLVETSIANSARWQELMTLLDEAGAVHLDELDLRPSK